MVHTVTTRKVGTLKRRRRVRAAVVPVRREEVGQFCMAILTTSISGRVVLFQMAPPRKMMVSFFFLLWCCRCCCDGVVVRFGSPSRIIREV